MSVTVLLVYGGQPGGRTERLCTAAVAGMRAAGENFELRERPALQATVEDLLWAQGILLATPEHFGYMSGALKDFFDRTFYPAEGRTGGLPWALFVSAGNDGRGTVTAVVAARRWKAARVGEEQLRQLLSSRDAHGASQCVLLTLGQVPESAAALAKAERVQIMQGEPLAQLLRHLASGKTP